MNAALRAWYRHRLRAYPWRGSRDPYRVLVSEVMLQQTQAGRVAPAYRSFIRRFPNVRALARAQRADVLRAWSGLGYNRRAVALSETARAILVDHDGRFPSDPARLTMLPGVGPYTAAAIASIAFGAPMPAIDTNLRRVVGRVRLGTDLAEPAEIEKVARRWIDREDPGGWNQALMDVGREHCRPVPRCDGCPLARACRYRRSGVSPEPRRTRAGARYEGSMRQLRGAIVAHLLVQAPATLGSLTRLTGQAAGRVAQAVEGLARDGIVQAGPAALRGLPRGRIRLR